MKNHRLEQENKELLEKKEQREFEQRFMARQLDDYEKQINHLGKDKARCDKEVEEFEGIVAKNDKDIDDLNR